MPGMRVLYVSGYSENDISDQGVVDPNLELLQKPFTPDTLTKKVRAVLDARTIALPLRLFKAASISTSIACRRWLALGRGQKQSARRQC